eukprot:CAMPEP_0171716814 /NCGR_PEP_ID=MMETSP0991-20121206/19670_1 /TAXON_ID=483369 /ORGANISM="non described non described, Strain CCMP2098" /LENGTH=91 /DNA_ID=CAMNT_0012307929 /DNA_START=315 /DNA_END=587 /DNA_ORIENTATION=+
MTARYQILFMNLVSPFLTSSLSSSQPPCRSKTAAAAAAAEVEIAVRPVYNFEKWGPTGAGKHLLRLFLQCASCLACPGAAAQSGRFSLQGF